MVRAETTIERDNRIPFSIAWAAADPVGSEAEARQTASTRAAAEQGLNLSGYQLLFGFALFIGFAGVFLWAFRLWLFEP